MSRVLLWVSVTYCAFKFAGMVLAKAPGFHPREISLKDRLLAGEPGLLLAAVLVAAPLALWMSSYSRRTFTHLYENSVSCHGRITALKHLAEIRSGGDSFTVYESSQGYKTLAFTAAAELGMKPGEVSAALAETASAHREAYAAFERRGMQQGMKEEVRLALRCLHPPAEPPNA